jgi:hypothetical protein
LNQRLMMPVLVGFWLTFSATSFGGLPNKDPVIPPPPPPLGAMPPQPGLSTYVCYDSNGKCNAREPFSYCDGDSRPGRKSSDVFICKPLDEMYRFETRATLGVIYKCECTFEYPINSAEPIQGHRGFRPGDPLPGDDGRPIILQDSDKDTPGSMRKDSNLPAPEPIRGASGIDTPQQADEGDGEPSGAPHTDINTNGSSKTDSQD